MKMPGPPAVSPAMPVFSAPGRRSSSWRPSFIEASKEAPPTFFDPSLVRTFMTPPPEAARALGFDVPGAREASCGRLFSPRSIGHLGFTGVSYWIDLDLGQIVILLTNRVHLGRDNDKIRPFRPQLYEAASRALGFSQIFRE